MRISTGLLTFCLFITMGFSRVRAEISKNLKNRTTTISRTRRDANQTNPLEVKVAWSDIVRLVDEHPLVVAGDRKRAAARAAVDAAAAVPNPELEVETAYGRAHDNSESRVEWGLALSIPLGWIAQRGAKINAAEAEVKMTDAESKAIRRKVLLQMQILFWNVVHEQERVKVLSKLAEETSAMVKAIKRKVEKEESRPIHAVRVEIEVEKISGRLTTAKINLKMKLEQLKLRLGIGRNRKLTAIADPEKLPEIMAADETGGSPWTAHPAVIAAQQRVRALQAEVTRERRENVPGVSLKIFANHELDRAAYGVAVAVDLPLWNFNSGRIRRAESLLAAGREKLDAEKMEIESAALEAAAACRAGVDLAIRYRDQLGPRAEHIAQAYKQAYKHGDATLLEMIDAHRTLLETRIKFVAALIDAQIECSRLAALVGKE